VAGLLDNLLASLALSNMQQPQPGNTYSPTGAEGMPDMSATDPFANAPAPAAPKPQFGPFAGLLNAPAGTPYSQTPFDLPPDPHDPQAHAPEVSINGEPVPKPTPDTGLNGRDEVATGAPLSLAPPMPSDSAQLPPGAAPTGPAAPSIAPSAPSAPSSGGIGGLLGNVAGKLFDPNHAATWMALASGFAGAPSLGMGIGRAAAAAGPAMQQDRLMQMRMQGIQATYQSVRDELQRQGVPAGQAASRALAMAQNPDLLKLAGPKIYGTLPSSVHTVTDMMGGQSLRVFDPNKGTFVDEKGSPVAGTSGEGGTDTPDSQRVFNSIIQARTAGANQDQLIQQVPVQLRSYVSSLLKGDAIPTNLPMRGNARTNALTLAHAIDPGFNENLIATRQTFAKSMGATTASSYGGQLKSAGTVMHHLQDANDALPVLESGMTGSGEILPALNPLKAAIRGQMGDQQYNDAMGHYKTAISGISNELEYLLKGGIGTDSSIKDVVGRLDITKNAPSTVRGALDEVRSLMMGRLSNVAQAKDRAFPATTTDPLTLLGPQERAIAERLQAGTYAGRQAASAAAVPAGAAPPVAPTAAPLNIQPPQQRVVGQTYPTPKGPMMWQADGWHPAVQ
jgi:hypothetical protein